MSKYKIEVLTNTIERLETELTSALFNAKLYKSLHHESIVVSGTRRGVTAALIDLTKLDIDDDQKIIMGKAATIPVDGRYYNVKISDGGVV